jgi:hypothetical protein
MNKFVCLLSIVSVGAVLAAQINPAPPAASGEIGLHAGRGHYYGSTRQVVYYDHVVVTNAQGRLSCERLTIYLPPSDAADSNPTNAVAETNLDIIYIDKHGETNHLVADKGVYAYSVINCVTNQTFTFGPHATNTAAKFWFTGEPLVWDNIKGDFDFGTNNIEMHIHGAAGGGTNGSPFNLMK